MLTGVGGPARTARATRSHRREREPASGRRRSRLALSLAGAGGGVLLFYLALRQSLTSAFNTDGAANVLQARALLAGNPLLRGWWTSDVSFYTTELPEYALVTAVRGLSPDVVHICGALTYTLTVVLAAQLARGFSRGPGPARGRGGLGRLDGPGLAGAGLATAIMLAPSVLGGTEVFLENPDHAGTAVPVLLLLLLLDRGERRRADGRDGAGIRWGLPAAAGLLLALTQVADELILAAATIPVALVCLGRLLRSARQPGPARSDASRSDASRSDASRRDTWLREGPLLAAALASVALARLAERALRALGGFHQRAIPGGLLSPLARLPGHVRVLGQSLVLIFGANNPGTPRQPLTSARHLPLVLLADLHVVGLLLAAAGLAAGIAAVAGGRADRVTAVLVVAIVVVMAAAVLSTVLGQLGSAHEVAILLPLAAVLAGRTLPVLPALAGRLIPGLAGRPGPRSVTVAARVALVAWLLAGLAGLGFAAAWPAAPSPDRALAAWLVAHHERDGLAAYWQADVTTVASGGRVLVAPVKRTAAAPQPWETSAEWYQPSRHDATFVIAVASPAAGAAGGLSVATVRARFGRPAATYPVAGDVVMTYRYNLLARLDDRVFPP